MKSNARGVPENAAWISLDDQGRIQAHAPEALELVGYVGQDLRGRAVAEILPYWDPGERVGFMRGGTGDKLLQVLYFKDLQLLIIRDATEDERSVRTHAILKGLNREFERGMTTLTDVVVKASPDGRMQQISEAGDRLFGAPISAMIGRSVYDLERQGVFRPSATAQVLKARAPVTTLQHTRAKRRLLVHGLPVFNADGRMEYVLNTSRDITDIENLRTELQRTQALVTAYYEELRKLLHAEEGIVYQSLAMRELIARIDRLAQVDATILIQGETGVGKELIARRLHTVGRRSSGPFVAVNCGAIPDTLLEAEFFGYEAGAFTGAWKGGKPGYFEAAHGGTLFLDEISDLPLHLQVKLLRVMQEREVNRLGARRPVAVDVRIVAATQIDLEDAVERGVFRPDLYYRLAVVVLRVPPLRERLEDLPKLVQYFVNQAESRYGVRLRFTPSAMDALMSYPWPGNVRQLENLIERLALSQPGSWVDRQDVAGMVGTPQTRRGGVETRTESLKEAVTRFETKLLEEAWVRYGSTREMAAALGINQSTVVRKLQKLGLAGSRTSRRRRIFAHPKRS